MRVLLDTHVFLWAIHEPSRLSSKAREMLEAGVNPFFSVASQWEIVIKHQAGKLTLATPATFLARHMEALKVTNLAVKSNHVQRVLTLENHHKDPFDRLLIAQALEEGCSIMTNDAQIVRYPVNIIW